MLLLFPVVDLVEDSLPAEVKKINNSIKEVDKVTK
jgi:hypothetical protein